MDDISWDDLKALARPDIFFLGGSDVLATPHTSLLPGGEPRCLDCYFLEAVPESASHVGPSGNQSRKNSECFSQGRSVLPDLPTELLVQIFRSAPTLEVAASLSLASKRLREVWEEHFVHIFFKLAPEYMPHYSEAYELAKIQLKENADAAGSVPSLASIATQMVKNYKTQVLLQKLIEKLNRYKRRAPNEGVKEALKRSIEVAHLSDTETDRFALEFYQTMTLLHMGADEQEQFLSEMTCRQLWCLRDFVVHWFYTDICGEVFSKLNIPKSSDRWNALIESMHSYIYEKHSRLNIRLASPYHINMYCRQTLSTAIWDENQESYVRQIPDVA